MKDNQFDDWLLKSIKELKDSFIASPLASLEDYNLRLGKILAYQNVVEYIEKLRRT